MLCHDIFVIVQPLARSIGRVLSRVDISHVERVWIVDQPSVILTQVRCAELSDDFICSTVKRFIERFPKACDGVPHRTGTSDL